MNDARQRENFTDPFHDSSKKGVDGCEVAVVIVELCDAPPVRYDGRVWVSIGPRRAMTTPGRVAHLAGAQTAGKLFERPKTNSISNHVGAGGKQTIPSFLNSGNL